MATLSAGAALAQQAQSLPPAKYTPELNQSGKDVVWVPTPDALAAKMLDLARVRAGDTLIDLGSGDGRLVILAAKRGAKALGIEYDAKLVDYAKRRAQQEGVAALAAFAKADLFASDLSGATVITVFLGPELNLKLLPKLLALKPGTRIVSNTHPIGDWPPDETAASGDDEKSVYYRTARLWIVPANVAGRWQWAGGALTLTQRYQTVAGTLHVGAVNTPVSHALLRGDRLRFEAAGVQYSATVAGQTLEGVMVGTGTKQPWRAQRQQ